MDPVTLPVYDAAGHVYAFPRGSSTVLGATSDDVGFDVVPNPSDADLLVGRAARLFPGIERHPRSDAWAGLRPMTPDGLAVIGRDPSDSRVFYACGHGRNGFLEAALTAEVVADTLFGHTPAFDLTPFSPARFSESNPLNHK
jgi:D-amino-acid dehydrogenase